MYKGIKILCIIPARAGSKGIPEKNTKQFIDRPLISWSIGQANESKHIDYLAVSTDDPIIKGLCEFTDTFCIDRPKEYCQDDSPSYKAIIHAIEHLKYNHALQYDLVLMLECTSPLRASDDIDTMIEEFVDNYGFYDSAIGVFKIDSDTDHPYTVKVESDGYMMPFISDAPPIYQRQQLNDAYAVFGGMYLCKIYKYLQIPTFYTDRTMGYKVKRWQKFEIDDNIDFICAETIGKIYL